ncbi:hypothetical protein Scep_017735 [Stephania cephalantha]|uniref:Uncharacterized protein n=1 Tax=Stephania cephalantha TaxID=152367 RepID=A0AAP0IRZ0_9MAGN
MPSCSCVNPPTFNIVNHIDFRNNSNQIFFSSCDIDVILLRRIYCRLIFPVTTFLSLMASFSTHPTITFNFLKGLAFRCKFVGVLPENFFALFFQIWILKPLLQPHLLLQAKCRYFNFVSLAMIFFNSKPQNQVLYSHLPPFVL